ncbi:MAG: transcriptional repressor [Deltaproteobacteria bacterium]|nr:transcriptional repressor [Deltaproteobacteria bacterium]
MTQRDTIQQRVVREAFEKAKRPLRPEEVLVRAQKRRPQIGMATVYRTIKTLLAANELCAVQLPGEATYYEISRDEHHHHFHCRTCKQVFEVESCPAAMSDFDLPGFTVERHEVTLFGLCKKCSKEPRRQA